MMSSGARGSSNERMILDQIVARGVRDPHVLDALRAVPRDRFVPQEYQTAAWEDSPLPLIHGQTISQPYIVAFMSETLRLQGHERVLEIGAGSGYQTAVLARLARFVYSAEIEAELAAGARETLAALGVDNVEIRLGNGVEIFRDQAPFDAILSAAAPETMPEELLEQLAVGGRCIIPVGGSDLQHLWYFERIGGRIERTRLEPVRFVPLRQHGAER